MWVLKLIDQDVIESLVCELATPDAGDNAPREFADEVRPVVREPTSDSRSQSWMIGQTSLMLAQRAHDTRLAPSEGGVKLATRLSNVVDHRFGLFG